METQLKDVRSGISATCVEEFLSSAENAKLVGQSQWSTPEDFAKTIAPLLPPSRETIADLTAGSGQLLAGLSDRTTRHLLAVEIQRMNNVKVERPAYDPVHWSRITGDATLVYPLMVQAGFECDLFGLNSPFNLHWYRERLADLATSRLLAVRSAFKEREPGLDKTLIDSTPATMMMALDRMTTRGEGVMIANNTTVERLIFDSGAPYSMLADHVWARFILDGNPMTDERGSRWEEDYKTAIIYFAAAHTQSCNYTVPHLADLSQLKTAIARTDRSRLRFGLAVVFSTQHQTDESVDRFDATKEEWRQRNRKQLGPREDFNIWLDEDGFVQTQLSKFDEYNAKVDKTMAAALHELKGRRPMELVMQVATRVALKQAVEGSMWRVDPKLPAAVTDAINDYNAVRAPLNPLSQVQRLGFLDEEKWILCTKDFYA